MQTLDFNDATAMVNALLGGSIDAASDVPASLVPQIRQAGLKTVTSESGMFNYTFWNTSEKPYSDARVCQALRLIMDRPQMVELALSGYGRVGNDMSAIYDPAYPTDIPQRVQDIDQAKSLLKQAGYPDLTLKLYTSPVSQSAVPSCTVLLSRPSRPASPSPPRKSTRASTGATRPHVGQRTGLVFGPPVPGAGELFSGVERSPLA